MRKIAVCALGFLCPVLASPTALGQEKPKVQGPEPAVGKAREKGVQAVELAVFSADGKWIALAADGRRVIYVVKSTPQPLMHGPFKSAVEELEKASQTQGDADLTKALRGLDAAEKAAMRARRSLVDLGKPEESPPENGDVVLQWADGRRILTAVRGWDLNGTELTVVGGDGRTPLEEARDSLDLAVLSVRQAPDVEGAKKALDDAEKNVAALRALLWKKQSSKKN